MTHIYETDTIGPVWDRAKSKRDRLNELLRQPCCHCGKQFEVPEHEVVDYR